VSSGQGQDDPRQRCRELQVIVDAIPALVFYKDAQNRILRVNHAVTEALGARASEMAGTEMRRWFSDDATAREDADLEVIHSGKPKLGVIERMNLPLRGWHWFETARLPEHDEHGRVVGLVVVSQDITERKHLESQLLQAQKLESIGKLAGGVAHDFNNLLTSFFGLIAAAQRTLPSDSLAHEYLALMQLAAEGGAHFTRQLLAFARRQLIEPRVVDLNGLVRETSALLCRVLGAHISVETELHPKSVAVRVDPSQISQLLMNLALNARDAMPESGKLTFQTASVELQERERWSLPRSPSGRFALLVVEDTGQGFSEEAKDHLFEPFFTSKALGQGTGLGLATCYGIVKQNGGHIAVDSKPGERTRFSIYLPEVDAPVEARRSARSHGPVRSGHETVLFVEDDDLVRHLSVAALSSSGYRLIEAAHGEDALRATAEHAGPIHLLVTDIIMPQLGGVELARRFRELRPEAAVLFISGYADGALNEVAPNLAILEKPFTNAALLARVREALDTLATKPAR